MISLFQTLTVTTGDYILQGWIPHVLKKSVFLFCFVLLNDSLNAILTKSA